MKPARSTLTCSSVALLLAALFIAAPAVAKDRRNSQRIQGEAAAGESCVSAYARCSQRCTTNLGGEPVDMCRRKHCDSKMAICRKNGCWQQDARFGGEVTCGLR
ncbi:MAG: hypothetical protein KF904_06255 [Rhodoblastus sp.]|nr:hypothetical protein [Rhodoblastus sp.]